MEDKIILEALSMKGTDWRVMAYLLWHPPKAQIVSDGEQRHGLCFSEVHKKKVNLH